MKSVAPQVRKGIIGGRYLTELIQSVLEMRIGFVSELIDVRSILEALLEEYFYGGSFKDDFYLQLSAYGIPTDIIRFAREEILRSIAEQVNLAFTGIKPCNHYSFEILPNNDVCVMEQGPQPLFKNTQSNEPDYDCRH